MPPRKLPAVVALLSAAVFATALATALAAAPPTREDRNPWTVHDSGSSIRVDHSAWQGFLGAYLDTASPGLNRVRYGKVARRDRESLEAYLAYLQGTQVSRLSRTEQKAYWINLYNTMTVALVVRHHPVKSILDINPGPGPSGRGPWDARILAVEGRKLSLNDIEHRILRPLWQDNLVHFGLNCASVGCPDLAPIAFTAANVDRLLPALAERFVNSPRGAGFVGDTLHLSSLFEWYRGDFGKDERQVLAFLSRFAAPDLKARLSQYSGKIRYRYDWSLNEAPAR